MDAVAAEVGWSRRHLSRQFRACIGVTPKTMAKILRFDAAASGIRNGGRLAEVAAACGYFDQAHLNREFRAMSGWSPTKWRSAQEH